MTEFALVAPLLLLFLFAILDFGRGIYYYVTLTQATNEGARVAVRAPTPPNPNFFSPSNAAVVGAVQQQAPGLFLVKASCANGPIDTTTPPGNSGYIYITQPNGAATPPAANAPGGQAPAPASGSCAQVIPAGVTPGQNNVPLQVTIRFNFVPVTPLITQFFPNGGIVLTGYATYRTEY